MTAGRGGDLGSAVAQGAVDLESLVMICIAAPEATKQLDTSHVESVHDAGVGGSIASVVVVIGEM